MGGLVCVCTYAVRDGAQIGISRSICMQTCALMQMEANRYMKKFAQIFLVIIDIRVSQDVSSIPLEVP